MMIGSTRAVIIVYSLEQAVAALAAAAVSSHTVLMLSQRYGASLLGAPVFKAIIERAATQVPEATFSAALDCGDDAGWAMAAIREGVEAIVFDPASPAQQRVCDIAAQAGIGVLAPSLYSEPHLDLQTVGDPSRACGIYLASGKPYA